MKHPIVLMGLTIISTFAAFGVPSGASAATLSSDAKRLLNTSPSNSQYEARYNNLANRYAQQAASHSLAFDDWFAINSFVNNERAAYGTDGALLDELVSLNVEDLAWEAGAHGVEVFFINEGAGYHNKFGYTTAAPSIDAQQSVQRRRLDMKDFWNQEVDVIWEDASSSESILANGGPLALGEGAHLDDVAAGETLSFFIRNGGNGTGDVFDALSLEDTMNADGLQHVTTYKYQEYLVLAFEDLWDGGDEDYNDVVIAVKGLTDTENAADVPEPTGVAALLSLGVVGAIARKKHLC